MAQRCSRLGRINRFSGKRGCSRLLKWEDRLNSTIEPLIGLLVLASCLTLAQLVGRLAGTGPLGALAREGLIILGWVAAHRDFSL